MGLINNGFRLNQSEPMLISTPSISIMSSTIVPCEYSIETPGFHAIGISPSKLTTVPTSYGGGRLRDFKWGPSAYGYLPPGMRQHGVITESAKATNILITDQFFREAAREEVNFGSFDARNLVAVSDPPGAHLITSLGAIAEAGETGEWPILIESIGAALALRIMHMMGAKLRIKYPSGGRLSRVIEYINDNLDSNITLVDMASVACLSIHHFARQFKTHTGQTPHGYVLQRRVNKAIELSRRGNMPLIAVAMVCGFSSQAHMTKAVKKQTGATPGEHQREAGVRSWPHPA